MWFFWPKTYLSGLILDKTVLTREANEHRSFNWILTHRKMVKPSGSQYDIAQDYYGFFPVNRPEYRVKDLTVFDEDQLDSLADALDFTYYADAYGIYTNEWVYGLDINERSRLVYGGLSNESYGLFKKMFQNRKLTIAEFNTLASPTALDMRFKMSELLELDFTGWTGRFYESLDTVRNPDIPAWMRRLHRSYYKRPFDYPDIPGVVLIHETERILVLQDGVDLDHEVPIIETPLEVRNRFDLPEYLRFPYWFDICVPLDTSDVMANYRLHTTNRGDSILASANLSNVFPAIIGDHQEQLRYYFCGDWADNPVPFGLAYFMGSQFLRKFFYNNRDNLDRKKFFWEYYVPMVTSILEDYMTRMDSLEPGRPLPPSYPNYRPFYRRNNIPLPDIARIASGRRYDPFEVLGERYVREAYRDSMRRAIEEEAARSGYFIGEYGDTIYAEELGEQRLDSLVGITPEERAQRALEAPSLRLRDTINMDSLAIARSPLPEAFDPLRFRIGYRVRIAKAKESDSSATALTDSATANPTPQAPTDSARPQRESRPSASGARLLKRPAPLPLPQEDKTQHAYHLVVASVPSEKQAQGIVEDLGKEAYVLEALQGGRYRVILEGFDDIDAAKARLRVIEQRFPGAWILSD